MNRKNFVEKFDLTKTNLKGYFSDGRVGQSRTIYADKSGNYYVFYKNDLHTFRPYATCKCFDPGNEISGHLGAGYSWYH